ncbi:hypothetical protein [Cytobacillus praedii]|uniref:hypothetical protein n=1 Tax=Cytobacillus praedii TaxID=1742358 RepID=UPI0013F46111|nr:hypothetical protein [Cytobacillus praedii]
MEVNVELNDLTQSFLKQIATLSEKLAYSEAMNSSLARENAELKGKIKEHDKDGA